MAEFIILNKTHWTEALSQVEKDKWTDHEKDKFAAAYQRWDIVQSYPDGYNPTNRSDFNPKFCYIRVPELSYKLRLNESVWDRKVIVAPVTSLAKDTWKLDVTVDMESVSHLEDVSCDNEIKVPPDVEIDTNITNGKRFVILPKSFTEQKTEKENKLIIGGNSINNSQLNGNVLTINYTANLSAEQKIKRVELITPQERYASVLGSTIDNMGLLMKTIKKRQFRFECQSQFEDLSLSEFNGRLKNKLFLTEQEINP